MSCKGVTALDLAFQNSQFEVLNYLREITQGKLTYN